MPRKPNLDRHRQVAKLRAQGLTHQEIGRRLGISRRTVQRALKEADACPTPKTQRPGTGSRKSMDQREAAKRLRQDKRVRDERRLLREPGQQAPVLISSELEHLQQFLGELVDYSQGGVSLLVDRAPPVGTILHVRLSTATDAQGVNVRVENCRAVHGRWRLGCQLMQEPVGHHPLEQKERSR